MVNPNVLWPDEHVEALREYMRDRVGSHAVIAGLMNARFRTGYSRNAIIGKCGRLGMPSNRSVPRKRAEPVARFVKPRIPSPNSPQAAALRCVEVDPQHLSLLELTDKTCKWPYGEASPYSFCGNPPLGKTAYCGPHQFLSMR